MYIISSKYEDEVKSNKSFSKVYQLERYLQSESRYLLDGDQTHCKVIFDNGKLYDEREVLKSLDLRTKYKSLDMTSYGGYKWLKIWKLITSSDHYDKVSCVFALNSASDSTMKNLALMIKDSNIPFVRNVDFISYYEEYYYILGLFKPESATYIKSMMDVFEDLEILELTPEIRKLIEINLMLV